MTRVSVRGALTILISEGLIEKTRDHGTRIRAIGRREVVDLLECRLALEAHCARRAAERIGEEEIARLHEIGFQMQTAVIADEYPRYADLDRELHRLVQACARQPVLEATLDRLNAQLVPQQLRSSGRFRPPGDSLSEHLSIVDAFSRRDAISAEMSVWVHIDADLEFMKRYNE